MKTSWNFRLPQQTWQTVSTVLCLSAGAVLWLGACSVDTPSNESGVVKALAAPPSAAVTAKADTSACQPEELAAFDKVSGDEVDLERESLPRGLYLATVSEMLLEKKGEPPVRLLVREVPGGKHQGDIVCSENFDRLGELFEMSITGVVKFETVTNPQGAGLTSRQFFMFSNQADNGVVLSNPKLADQNRTFKQVVTSPASAAQLYRLNERHYLLKSVRERDGVRVRLMIHLEMIPQN